MRGMWWLICGALLCDPIYAASFDCKLAKTPVEKAVCSDSGLSAADDRMASVYKSVMAMAPVDLQAQIRRDQRLWLNGLDRDCTRDARAQAKPVNQEQYLSCLKQDYKMQTAFLAGRVQKKAGIVFVEDTIELTAKDDADDHYDKDLEKTAGYGTLDASWPQAVSDDPKWKSWNAAVLLEVQKMAGGANNLKVAGEWNKDWAAGAEDDVTAKLGRVSEQMVSVALEADDYGHGAAHPNEGYEQFHWLLKAQRRLEVSDVFASEGWVAVAVARCRASLKRQMGDDYDSYPSSKADFAKMLREVVVDPGNWSIHEKGIEIDFPEYSVTPRSNPANPVTVPWSALQPYLNRGFVVPQ